MTVHDTDSLDCPCGPDYFVPCDEHEVDGETCWRCAAHNGLLPLTRAEADACDDPIVIVHQEDYA